ncbi:ATP-dependent DNA helicase DDX11 [Drosophila subobscura]|uniref:ATP-dependent DNA helicase DDX11 n=1 Tax=Drosophila subobscura TaxID=7241 RepID=UPI00155AAE67|nr:ATP-dependent DNA helicase DDX11 [Drosophila subobscura]
MAQYSPRQCLDTPEATDFGFPFAPYAIQEQLMQELFSVLERRQVGIFESPTGTGKSLTLTCGALTWLHQHEELVRSELLQRIAEVEKEIDRLQASSAQAEDWISAQSESREQQVELQQLNRLRSLLEQREQQLARIRERTKERKKHQKFRTRTKPEGEQQQPEDIEPPSDADADSDSDHELADGPEEQSEDRYRAVQIFFCSRTHSQLAQIVAELRKTPHAAWVRCVSLGSRQQLCINPQVRKLRNVGLMNERCLDMARSKAPAPANPSKKSRLAVGAATSLSRCPFKTPALVESLRDVALCEPLDIEELAAEGSACGGCSYYASRSAQDDAQLVLLPYQLLLQQSARQQLGIDLRGSIVIVDEAHNLLDSIAQLHGSELTRSQLELARDQVTGYKEQYARRLSTRNLLRINQLIFVLRRLLKLLEPKAKEDGAPPQPPPPPPPVRMLRTYELSSEGDFDNIDLHALLEFCGRTRFAQKVQGHAARAQREPRPSENQPPASSRQTLLQRLAMQHQTLGKQPPGKRKLAETQPEAETEAEAESKEPQLERLAPSPIRPLLAFIETLTSNAADGRVLLNVQAGIVKYLLLDPAEHFDDILSEARAIVIAGGTMQPTQELKEQLFARCPERLVERFYSHVVPPDAVLPFVVAKGPTGASLCFSYAQRSTPVMLKELSMVLQNLCNVVPAGVVCFLPSYEYLDTVHSHLEQSGGLETIARKKRIFRESSGAADQLLQQYAEAPGLLLAVVGGKLSEGLNFADDLGRAVLVVGLPYPNRNAPELQQRMRHLDERLGPGAGNEYYENLCMKAVNQCIGRSVRHIRDYACVFLLDERYASARIRDKLPDWIARHIAEPNGIGFGAVQARTARFFKSR